MTRDEILESLRSRGYVAEPCHSENFIAIRCGESHDENERMRLTQDGQLLTAIDGYFWQIGTTEGFLESLEKNK